MKLWNCILLPVVLANVYDHTFHYYIMAMAQFGWNRNEVEIDVFEFESIINIHIQHIES